MGEGRDYQHEATPDRWSYPNTSCRVCLARIHPDATRRPVWHHPHPAVAAEGHPCSDCGHPAGHRVHEYTIRVWDHI